MKPPQRRSGPRAEPDARPRPDLGRALADELERTARRGQADDAMRWLERAQRAAGEGDHAGARRAAVRAKQGAPRSATVRRILGEAALALGEYHEAAQELLAYRRFSADRGLDPAIARCYRAIGRPARALEFLSDLPRAAVPPDAWLDAQVERALALADSRGVRAGLDVLRGTSVPRGASAGARERLARAAAELAERPTAPWTTP